MTTQQKKSRLQKKADKKYQEIGRILEDEWRSNLGYNNPSMG